MEACDTAGIMDAIMAVTGVLTLLVAWAALFSWRRQERQKAILAWKADLVDYAYGFPNLPVIWGYQTHKDEIDQAAERLSVREKLHGHARAGVAEADESL